MTEKLHVNGLTYLMVPVNALWLIISTNFPTNVVGHHVKRCIEMSDVNLTLRI